jgi:site-specific recombinase XerD
MEVAMLDQIFLKPQTIDRIVGCWLGQRIQQYETILSETGYSARSIMRRVPILVQFADFTAAREIGDVDQAEGAIDSFVDDWLSTRCSNAPVLSRRKERNLAECTVRHFYSLVVWKADYQKKRRTHAPDPFVAEAPGFFTYLREERGLQSETLVQYRHHLRRFAAYLDQAGLSDLRLVSLPLVTGFITTMAQEIGYPSMIALACTLRVFLRYLAREGFLDRDISKLVEIPQRYRLADIPRSISWEAVQKVLEQPERRTVVGRRDFAMLLLMAIYGLRSREIAALTLDDIDWKRDRLHVRERKADHTTAYPLAPAVGEAIIDYLKNGRPDVPSRVLFWRHLAPRVALTHNAVSSTASKYLHKAGVAVRRPGSHTLRHACVQRLVDSGFPLKTIGDYVGHRSASSTMIYAKVQIDALREVALGDGEDLR